MISFFKAQPAFTQLLQAIDITEPKGAWQYYEISQVVVRVVSDRLRVVCRESRWSTSSVAEILKYFIKVKRCSNERWRSIRAIAISWSKVVIKLWWPRKSMKPSSSTRQQRKHKQTTCLLCTVSGRLAFDILEETCYWLTRYYSLPNTRRKIQRSKTTAWVSKRSSSRQRRSEYRCLQRIEDSQCTASMCIDRRWLPSRNWHIYEPF